MNEKERRARRIDHLLDAIELVKLGRRPEAVSLLRELVHEDNNFEEAWLWMSVAVESVDQSVVCLDNVLRVNPHNMVAVAALFRLRESEIAMLRRRAYYRWRRDMSLALFWVLVLIILYGALLY